MSGSGRKDVYAERNSEQTAVEEVSLREYLRILARRRWWFMGPLLIAVIAATLLSFTPKPRFRCAAQIFLPGGRASGTGSLAGLLSTAMPPSGPAYDLPTQATVIKSWPLQRRTLELLRSFPDFFRECTKGERVIGYVNDIPREILEAYKKHLVYTDDLGAYPLDPVSMEMLKQMRVGPVEQSSVLELSLVTDKPYEAADLLNALCVTYLLDDMRTTQVGTENALQYTAQEMTAARERLNQAEAAVTDFQRQYGLVDAPAQARKLVDAYAALKDQYTALVANLDAQRAQDEHLERELNKQSPTAVSSQVVSRNPMIQQLESQAATLQSQRVEQLMEYTEESATIQAIDAKIAALQDQMKKTIQEIVTQRTESTSPVYTGLLQQYVAGRAQTMMTQARLAPTRRAIASVEAELRKIPETAQRLAVLQREAQIAQESYLGLRRQYEQYRVAKANKTSPLYIVAPAFVNGELLKNPDWPRPMLIFAVALFLGLLIGTALALVREFTDEGYPEAAAMEADLGVPIIATFPPGADDKRYIVTDPDCPPELRDAFMGLLLNLRFANRGKMVTPVLLTSARSRNDMGWMAYNLGLTAARTGKRVVVLDCNLRQPSLQEVAELTQSLGLAEVLCGREGVDKVVQWNTCGTGYLGTLPAGSLDPSVGPAFVWDSDVFSNVIHELSQDSELIVIAAPAVLDYPDALAISSRCGGVALALRKSVARSDAREATEALWRTEVPLLGLVVSED